MPNVRLRRGRPARGRARPSRPGSAATAGRAGRGSASAPLGTRPSRARPGLRGGGRPSTARRPRARRGGVRPAHDLAGVSEGRPATSMPGSIRPTGPPARSPRPRSGCQVLDPISPSASLWTARASMTRTVSLSRSRSSSKRSRRGTPGAGSPARSVARVRWPPSPLVLPIRDRAGAGPTPSRRTTRSARPAGFGRPVAACCSRSSSACCAGVSRALTTAPCASRNESTGWAPSSVSRSATPDVPGARPSARGRESGRPRRRGRPSRTARRRPGRRSCPERARGRRARTAPPRTCPGTQPRAGWPVVPTS